MDDQRNMKDSDPLRDLFAEVGPATAAEGLQAAVLAQLARGRVVQQAKETPLIPSWAWGIAVSLGLALVLWPQGTGITWEIPALPDVTMTNHMRWILGAVTCAVLLFALDSVLRLRAKGSRTH